MAKIYYKKYKAMIDYDGIPLETVYEMVESEVPMMWKNKVIELLKENYEQHEIVTR